MKEEEFQELYPDGVYYDIDKKTIAYAIAFAVSKQVNDGVDDVTIIEEDPRVCFVSTCGHGYYALVQWVGKYPPGLVIAEEDEGLDEEWMNLLQWKSEYSPDPL
jgi:hypothetical protein